MPLIKGFKLGSSAMKLFECPADIEEVSMHISFCNTNESDSEEVTIYAVSADDTGGPADTNEVEHKVIVDPGDTFKWVQERLQMGAGDEIWAKGENGGRVSVIISHMKMREV
jgi:hypothetical protein